MAKNNNRRKVIGIDINSIKDNIIDMIHDQVEEITEYSSDSYDELIKNCMLYIAKKIIEEYEE